jgi:DNA-binding transcriptional LysR family regulator
MAAMDDADARLSSIDLNLLVVLDAVLKDQSVQRAAERLALTPSAVSHALRRLRELVGDPLLVRTPAGLVATARAQRLAEPLADALAQLRGLLDDDSAFAPATASRAFAVASADLAQLVLLPPLLRELARVAPQLRLLVRPPRADPFAALASGALDLAFGVFSDAPAGFRCQTVFRDQLVCMMRRDHAAAAAPLSLDRYLGLSHLSVAPGGTRGSFVDDALERLGHKRRIAVVLPHFLVSATVVAETELVAAVPSRLARHFVTILPLAVQPLPFAVEPFAIAQMWHERVHQDPAHAWLRRLIVDVGAHSA